MSKSKRNDRERELWVLNDEGLYSWWKTEKRGERDLRGFIRENREELDRLIDQALAPRPPKTWRDYV